MAFQYEVVKYQIRLEVVLIDQYAPLSGLKFETPMRS